MKLYYYSLLMFGCGAVYALVNPGGSSGRTQKSETDNAASNTAIVETRPAVKQNTGARDLSTYPEELCEQIATGCEPAAGRDENGSSPAPPKLRDDINISPLFVIATVPDPATTHLRVEFDRAIDGIKDAAADQNFLLRRYWFPWPAERPKQFSDRASQEGAEKELRLKRRFPGFLLFENGSRQSLIVLLVGESPTDGIHRQQFDTAIQLRQEIGKLGNTTPGRICILGTSFSGSLHTLDLALTENHISDFKAVSGTVTDKKSIQSFNTRFQRGAESPLRTLRHDSATTLTIFRNYLRETWQYKEQVAILSETDTVFGALQDVRDDFFLIPFPRDIAHLRNAYQSYPELSGFASTNPDQQQQKNLPLPLDDTRNTIDSIPDFAPQTVVSQETMVLQIANRIRHEHIRFAGIIGTDVLDVLFICRFMRAASPDTRLFLLDPDLLFVHAADALPFEGVLAVATYPLLDGNPPFEGRSTPDETHWMFPTPFQQGIHNAMRVLMADMGLGKIPKALPGYDKVDRNDDEPALWITSVGRESFVPIAVLGMNRTNRPRAEPALAGIPKETEPLPRGPHEPTRIWWFLLVMATCAIIGLALKLIGAQTSSKTWLSDFRVRNGAGNQQQISILLVFATGMYLVVMSAGIRFPPDRVSLLCAAAGLIAIGGLCWACLRSIKLHNSSVLTVGAVGVSVAAVIVLFVYLGNKNNSQILSGVFFNFRSFELSAGAAPTLPFLCLLGGFLVCSFVNLQRSIFHHQRRQFLPRAKCDPVLGGNVWEGAKRLRWQLYKPFRRSRTLSVPLAAAAFILCYAGLHESGIRSFEGIWYDRLFTVWASALAAALVVVCGHFWESWRLLNRILDQLEAHPVRRALSALPADHSWSPIWQSSPRKRNYLVAARSIDALAALRDTGLCSQKLTRLIDATEERVGVILGRAARGERETPMEHLAAQRAIADTADNLVGELQPVWKRGSSEIVDESKEAGKKHEDELPPLVYAFEFVAMCYLAFIRYVMVQLRNMITFLSLGFLAFAFALMSYPFQGERLIAWVITLLFGVLSLVIIVVFAQMEKDPTLSRITNRDSGKLGFAFFHRALVFGSLPLLTVLASNFNSVGRLLFSWIEPALRTLH
jgi:hypothetical protein